MSKMLWIFKWEEKEKGWVVMGMLVGKRWGELDGSFFFFEKTDGVNIYIYIYIYIKETKSSQHMQIELFFFLRRSK